MSKYLKICLFGLVSWLIPFVVAFLIYSLHESERPLFESIMAAVVTFSVVIMATLYFRTVQTRFLTEGVMIGIIWLVINLVIDLMMFSTGPMKMSFADYMKDIGVTYLIIPIVAVGLGYCLGRRKV